MQLPQFSLTKQSGFGRGKSTKVEAEEVSFGTASHCHVQFDPTWDKTVDGSHGVLLYEGGSVTLHDKSSQGCFIDGRRIQREAIVSGSEIELGKGGPKMKVEYTLPQAQQVAPTRAAATPAPRREVTPPVEASVPTKQVKPFPKALVVSCVAGAIVVAAIASFFVLKGGGEGSEKNKAAGYEDNDTKFAKIIEEYKEAVAVVVFGLDAEDGGPTPSATAWAIGDHAYATNSHVTVGVENMLDQGVPVYLATNQNSGRRLKVLRVIHHPLYGSKEKNFEGKNPAIGIGDVGILITEEKAPKVLPVAPREELEKLRSGYAICFMGFPMEGLSGGGVDPRNPVATMQSGIVTSNTDFWLGKAPYEKRLLISHNMGATGGASGSPLINAKGQVVGILSAGNIIGQVVHTSSGEISVKRAPSAAMINFGQRVDQLKLIYKGYPR